MTCKILFLAAMHLGISPQLYAQAAVGQVADDQTYAEFRPSNVVADANLKDHVGKVVVIYYYTPW